MFTESDELSNGVVHRIEILKDYRLLPRTRHPKLHQIQDFISGKLCLIVGQRELSQKLIDLAYTGYKFACLHVAKQLLLHLQGLDGENMSAGNRIHD